MSLADKTSNADLMHVVRQLRFTGALKLIARNAASFTHYYLLRFNLSRLPQTPPSKLGGGELEFISDKDLASLYKEVPALDYPDRRELLSRIVFLKNGFKNCYVLKENGAIAHMQWVIYPSENNIIHEYYRRRFIPLQAKQVMIENAFTFPQYRGRGFFPFVAVETLRLARKQGFTNAVTYVNKESLNSLNHLTELGFKLVQMIPEYKVLGRTWRCF